MKFSKWHGLGNDFIIINGFEEKVDNPFDAAVKLCDRHFGIGADGLAFLLPSDIADFKMRLINSDGSEADMCGNLIRCIARYVFEYKMTDKTNITVETRAGIMKPELKFKQGKIWGVRVDMGEPLFTRGAVPMIGPENESSLDVPVSVDGQQLVVNGISMGNPHGVIFVEDIEKIDLLNIGAKMEKHQVFPNKANIEFVQVLGKNDLRMRVFERGAGVTMACGTGSCASVVAAVLHNYTERKAYVHLDGGDLFIEWENNNHVYMTGPAEKVFCGEIC